LQEEENLVKIIDSAGKTVCKGEIVKNDSSKQFDLTVFDN
jgi:hypothetical protein